MQPNSLEFCENWHWMTGLSFGSKGLHLDSPCTGKPYGILKVREALARSVYCIRQYTICGVILQVIKLALGVTQPCSYLVQGVFARERVGGS
jgi:hypothetical protein